MSKRSFVYAFLAIVGLSATWYHNIAFAVAAASPTPGSFFEAVFANHASSSIGWDIGVACTAFLIFVTSECRRLGMKHVWVWYVLTLCVAFAFAGPLFFFMRERALSAKHKLVVDASAHSPDRLMLKGNRTETGPAGSG